jgi:hypothetical protein
MTADLDGTPTAGVDVQLCGDAHLSNFGLFASPERRRPHWTDGAGISQGSIASLRGTFEPTPPRAGKHHRSRA